MSGLPAVSPTPSRPCSARAAGRRRSCWSASNPAIRRIVRAARSSDPLVVCCGPAWTMRASIATTSTQRTPSSTSSTSSAVSAGCTRSRTRPRSRRAIRGSRPNWRPCDVGSSSHSGRPRPARCSVAPSRSPPAAANASMSTTVPTIVTYHPSAVLRADEAAVEIRKALVDRPPASRRALHSMGDAELQSRLLGMVVPRLAWPRVPVGPPATTLARVLPAAVRHGRVELDLLPAAHAGGRRAMGGGGPARVSVRAQAGRIRIASQEARRRRNLVAQPSRSGVPARRPPRADTRAAAAAVEAKRRPAG